MKLMNNVSKEEKKLIRKMFWRSGAMYASVNPVTMGGGGFCYSMIPFIAAPAGPRHGLQCPAPGR